VITLQQRLRLGEEVLTSVRLIAAGLAEVQAIDGRSDFRHAALLLLSGGLERLMKCVICYRRLHVRGSLPSANDLKRLGHDLEELLKVVSFECFDPTYQQSRTWAADDAAYLSSDPHVAGLVCALSRFSRSSRYYNLDVVGGSEPDVDSPEMEWSQLMGEVLDGVPGLWEEFIAPETNARAYQEIARVFVSRIERFTRALSRLFVLGSLGPEAKAVSGYTHAFLMLDDADLGARQYRGMSVP